MSQSDTLSWLIDWYATRCDGEWEHNYGIEIGTLDNPGWTLRIDLRETNLETVPFEELKRNYDDDVSWYICRRDADSFIAACGARDLDAVLRVFRDWAMRANHDLA